jgi:inner membrane protein
MDPFAHTLFGAALADAGLKRTTRYATAALLIGANLPDIDIVAQFSGADAALYARRGWSHGVLAMVALPMALAAMLMLWHRWVGRRSSDAPPLRPAMLLALACVGVGSHPLLDWLNTYGVRLLMPFDGRWFHGDTLFIVDPWVWLMLAAGVVVSRSVHWPAMTAWKVLAALATWLVFSRDLPAAVPLAWVMGLATIVLLRWRVPPERRGRVAQVGLASMLVYVAGMFGLARHAEMRAAERFPGSQTVQASPAPGQPFAHRIVVVHADRYRIVDPDGGVMELQREPMDDVVRRALADPSIRGFANWTRFPWWQVDETADGWQVRFHDLRYSRPGDRRTGIGYAEVMLPRP